MVYEKSLRVLAGKKSVAKISQKKSVAKFVAVQLTGSNEKYVVQNGRFYWVQTEFGNAGSQWHQCPFERICCFVSPAKKIAETVSFWIVPFDTRDKDAASRLTESDNCLLVGDSQRLETWIDSNKNVVKINCIFWLCSHLESKVLDICCCNQILHN